MKFHRTFYVAIIGATILACSQQSEGERCMTSNNDADCASGLQCVAAADLAEYGRNPLYAADRCCPPDGTRSNDARCERATDSSESTSKNPGSGGSSSANSTAGTAGTGAESGAMSGTAGSGDANAGSAGVAP